MRRWLSACRVTQPHLGTVSEPCVDLKYVVWRHFEMDPKGCSCLCYALSLQREAGEATLRTRVDVLDGDLEAIEGPGLRGRAQINDGESQLSLAALLLPEIA